MRLFKAHGLGNDYLVLEQGPALDAAWARRLCDRHRGPGADGVLEPFASERANHGVRIWNPDGSIAEKSGNGIRILAFWLRRDLDAGDHFTVDTGHEVVMCHVEGSVVTVEMGTAGFDPALIEAPFEVDAHRIAVTSVDVGNPHAVVFRDDADLDALPWRRWGAVLERHAAFPHRTNVQVARVVAEGVLEARIWERGAGETLASGSSACAVAAAAVRTGRLDAGPLDIQMEGGTLHVTVREDWSLRLRGPVAPIGRFELDSDFR